MRTNLSAATKPAKTNPDQGKRELGILLAEDHTVADLIHDGYTDPVIVGAYIKARNQSMRDTP